MPRTIKSPVIREPPRRPAALRVLPHLLLIAALTLAASPSAVGHEPGEGTITKEGAIELGSAGSLNDSYHTLFLVMGLSMHAGDILAFSWLVNDGRGPPVFFDIHAHTQDAEWETFYNITAIGDTGTWTVPETENYMVLWRNDNDVAVNVTYSFDLYPAPAADYLPLILLGVAAGVFGFILYVGLRRRARAAEEPPGEE